MSTTVHSYNEADTLLGAALAPMDWTRSVSLVFVFSLIVALAAQFRIPLLPVPMTGQTFAVLLTGALLGSRLGAMSMIVYLLEGASGLPFFQGGHAGLLYLLGPTGGYLFAFPAAAFVTGAFAENGWDKRYLSAIAAMAAGSVLILISGWAWFSFVTHTAPGQAFKLTVAPFLIWDAVKIALAAAVLPSGWYFLKRKASQ
jgi:biotin transport system substrate-specific component